MGLVIATGISIGTLFTLFVVPAMYLLLAVDHARSSRAGAELPVPPPAGGSAKVSRQEASFQDADARV
jgi:multidrug efflux pump